jgi:hypothetical protein
MALQVPTRETGTTQVLIRVSIQIWIIQSPLGLITTTKDRTPGANRFASTLEMRFPKSSQCQKFHRSRDYPLTGFERRWRELL